MDCFSNFSFPLLHCHKLLFLILLLLIISSSLLTHNIKNRINEFCSFGVVPLAQLFPVPDSSWINVNKSPEHHSLAHRSPMIGPISGDDPPESDTGFTGEIANNTSDSDSEPLTLDSRERKLPPVVMVWCCRCVIIGRFVLVIMVLLPESVFCGSMKFSSFMGVAVLYASPVLSLIASELITVMCELICSRRSSFMPGVSEYVAVLV